MVWKIPDCQGRFLVLAMFAKKFETMGKSGFYAAYRHVASIVTVDFCKTVATFCGESCNESLEGILQRKDDTGTGFGRIKTLPRKRIKRFAPKQATNRRIQHLCGFEMP